MAWFVVAFEGRVYILYPLISCNCELSRALGVRRVVFLWPPFVLHSKPPFIERTVEGNCR
jgi:hypothetical protein